METREFISNIKVTISENEVRIWVCNENGCQFRFKAIGKVVKSGNDIMVIATNRDRPSRASHKAKGLIMSAYIVEDETINRVVSYLAQCEQKRETWITLPIKRIGYELGNAFHCKRLAEEMFTLNCDSVEQRYEEGSSRDDEFTYQQISSTRFNRFQVLKSLACFLYQACEGSCIKQPLYQALEAIKGKIAYDILSDTPEYDNAAWR